MTTTVDKTLIIRADASIQIGAGHVLRSLALAQAWKDGGGHAIFVMAMESSMIEERLQSEGMEVAHLSTQGGSAEDAIQTRSLARKRGATWVVLDGYQFGADYQRIIKDAGLRLLVIDDNGHSEAYYADLVLNQNLHAHQGLYVNIEPYALTLLGNRYVLLRREFLKWRGWGRQIPGVAHKVLVTLGGGDLDNMTSKVINGLKKVDISNLDVRIVVGPSNPHIETLQKALLFAPCSMRILHNVTNMPELMAWADVALSAGGSTCWELAFMGLPALIITVADNQHAAAERLDAIGVAANLGRQENLSSDEIAHALSRLLLETRGRAQMSQRAQNLVDGEGASRVLMHLQGKGLRLRQVCEDDCRLLWDWANDPQVREISFSSGPVSWEEHVRWFKSKINDPNCTVYIVTGEEGIPIGQVRYDTSGDEAVISLNLDRGFRGKGYGSKAIRLACQELFERSRVSLIHAYVKQGNDTSVRVFVKAGFQNSGITMVQEHKANHLILSKQKQTPCRCIEINGHTVGPGHSVYVVAELSANHCQSFDRAVELIRAAKESGAAAVKLQTYTPDTMTIMCDNDYFRIGKGTIWEGRNLYDLYREAYTPWEWQPKLKAIADELGIDLFCTAFDPTAIAFLEEMGTPAYKLASFEIVDIPLIEKMARTGRPIIISTGMATLGEIEEAVQAARSAGATQIALLKCTSAYPAPPEEMNLHTIPHLAQAFCVPVGLSDHTLGNAVPAAAVALGAGIIEKHFTLSRDIPGPDSSFSLEPHEFREMVEVVRTTERALGKVHYGVSEHEVGSRVFRRSLFVVQDVKAGEVFTEENIRSIRPGYGLPPKYIKEVLGKKATRDIQKGTPLEWTHIC